MHALQRHPLCLDRAGRAHAVGGLLRGLIAAATASRGPEGEGAVSSSLPGARWLRCIFVGRRRIGSRADKKRQTTVAGFAGQRCFESRRTRVSHTVTRQQPIWSNEPDYHVTRSTGTVQQSSIARAGCRALELRGRQAASVQMEPSPQAAPVKPVKPVVNGMAWARRLEGEVWLQTPEHAGERGGRLELSTALSALRARLPIARPG